MNSGWVKVHRKMLENDFLRSDVNAKVVFLTLLLTCDRDGNGSFGREILGYKSGLKSITAYKAFLRLKKANMVTQSSNNKYTSFSICKWKEYQSVGNNNGNNEVTTREQRGNNAVTHYKNKEVIIKNNNNVEIQSIYDYYIQKFDSNPNKFKLTAQRKIKIGLRLKDAGKDNLIKAIDNVSESNFHRGENDRNWKADLDFIIRSYEQVEKLANMSETRKIVEFKI